jgi:hypothetical protein
MFRKPGEVVAVTAKVGGKRWWVEPMMVVKDTAVCSVLYIAPGVWRPEGELPVLRID